MSKAERQALKGMSAQAERAWESLSSYEKEGFVAVPELCQGLKADPITFITFSCLGTYKGKEELKLNLRETFFFRKFIKPAKRLFEDFESANVQARFIVILPDTEPRETWRWKTSQEELTGYCRLMAEDGMADLPISWEVVLWSDLSLQVSHTFEQALQWAKQSAPPLLIRAEAEHIRSSPAFGEILLLEKPTQTAIRQVAAYAWQGKVLEELFPSSIFLQSEFPAVRKDKMYQPLRIKPLPIVHPFEL